MCNFLNVPILIVNTFFWIIPFDKTKDVDRCFSQGTEWSMFQKKKKTKSSTSIKTLGLLQKKKRKVLLRLNCSVSISSASQEKGHNPWWHSLMTTSSWQMKRAQKRKPKLMWQGPPLKHWPADRLLDRCRQMDEGSRGIREADEMFDRHVGAERVEKVRSRHWRFTRASVLV